MKLPFLYLSVFSLLFSVNFFAQDKPNIILIMADDLGWGDTGYNGSSFIQTPYLDAMASEGIRFDRFYAASAVCSPTRASVLIGRNPYRSGVFFANDGVLRPEEITIAEVLKDNGYTTGVFGKWHLGTMTHTENDANRGAPGNLAEYNPPNLHGFDKVFATESKVPTYNPMIKPETVSTPYGTSFWDENDTKVTDNVSGDASEIVMDRVLPFIDDAKRSNTPFVAVVWFHAPHKPYYASERHLNMYSSIDNEETRRYAGCITAMDEQIGRLRAHLKSEGIDQNTLITFCSDNGPESGTIGSSGGFRNRKRSLYEGGIRVPGLLVWPEKVQSPIVTNEPFVTSDYFPTILDILDIDMPNDRDYDGESFLPLIENDLSFKRSEGIGFVITNKLSYQTADCKLHAQGGNFEMYDMINDDEETTNIIDQNELKANDLKQQFRDWLTSVESSFNGAEYGTDSYNKLNQTFVYPYADYLSINSFSDVFTKITVYPNPTQNILHISNSRNDNLVVTIFNLVGKQLYKNSINESIIDISGFSKGVYVLSLSNKNGEEKAFKIVKR